LSAGNGPNIAQKIVSSTRDTPSGLNQQGQRQPLPCGAVEAEIRAIIDAIKAGLRTPSMQLELLALEQEKETLLKNAKARQPQLTGLRPHLDRIYREKIARLE
jgi:hypothetical protein